MENNKTILTLPVLYSEEMRKLVAVFIKNPYWIAGFFAGEGCFFIGYSNGSFSVSIQLSLTSTNQHLLWAILAYFNGLGKIYESHSDTAKLVFNNLDFIVTVLIPFFDKYPILGSKARDYEYFREAAIILHRREHLTEGGYKRLIELYAGINTGRNYFLEEPIIIIKDRPEYTHYIGPNLNREARLELAPSKKVVIRPKEHPDIKYTKKMENLVSQVQFDPYWIAGLVAGEGSFYLGIDLKAKTPQGARIRPYFQIALSSTNQQLLWAIWVYFGKIGTVCSASKGMARFLVGSIKDNNNVIIPFFDKYYIQGNKAKDFEDFKEALGLMKTKAHLTLEGHWKCKALKEGMNSGRDCSLPENRVMIIQN